MTLLVPKRKWRSRNRAHDTNEQITQLLTQKTVKQADRNNKGSNIPARVPRDHAHNFWTRKIVFNINIFAK